MKLQTVKLRFLLFLALVPFTYDSRAEAGVVSRATGCASYVCMMAGSIPCFAEQYVRFPLIFAKASWTGLKVLMGKKTGMQDIISTDRAPIQVFDALGLHFVDFTGLDVLDVGAGKSRFGQVMNLAYAWKGTHVEGLDANTTGPLLSWPGHVTQADAFQMPYDDHSFHLVLNSFMYIYYVPYTFSEEGKEAAEDIEKMEKARELLSEHLRVVKPGGEVRISLQEKSKSEKAAAFLQYILKRDPRVKEVRFQYKTGWVGTMIVQMRDDSDKFPNDSLLKVALPKKPNKCPAVTWQWTGFPTVETAAGLGILGLYIYRSL